MRDCKPFPPVFFSTRVLHLSFFRIVRARAFLSFGQPFSLPSGLIRLKVNDPSKRNKLPFALKRSQCRFFGRARWKYSIFQRSGEHILEDGDLSAEWPLLIVKRQSCAFFNTSLSVGSNATLSKQYSINTRKTCQF